MLLGLTSTHLLVGLGLAVVISIIFACCFLFQNVEDPLWWLLPKGARKRGPFTTSQLRQLLREVSHNGLSVRKGDSGEWYKWVNAGEVYPDLVQMGLVDAPRSKPVRKTPSSKKLSPGSSPYFSCPHCEAVLGKTGMDLAYGQAASAIVFSNQTKERCPNCKRQIDRKAIIDGTYDISENEVGLRRALRLN